MTRNFSLNSILDDNPCPSVNPYVVAEYMKERRVRSAREAYNVALGRLMQTEMFPSGLTVIRNPYHDWSCNKVHMHGGQFEAHGYKCRWVEDYLSAGLSFAGYADKVTRSSRFNHTGWYADAHQSTLYRGAVFRIEGTRKFLVGYMDPENDGAALIEMSVVAYETGGAQNRGPYVDDDDFMDTLARSADKFAEVFAEEAREHDEAWHELRDAKEKADEARAAAMSEVEALRAASMDDGTRADLADQFCDVWDEYKQAMRDLAEKLHWAGKWHGITLGDVA